MNSVKIKRANPAKKSYHHGDLRRQLLKAAEEIILEKGVDGFTLREAARRAGVSPAAPAHHFGDAKGLLSEVAFLGFREFGDALAQADKQAGTDPAARLHEQGMAYVKFALTNPARFQLMFRHDKCDMTRKDLAQAADRSFEVLARAIRAANGLGENQPLTSDAYGMLMAVWSLVHGFAHLALGGELDHPARQRGGKKLILSSFLPLTLAHLPLPRGKTGGSKNS